MHIGPFDNELETVAAMDRYIAENGYENDLSDSRLHHEIYLSDARKVQPEKWNRVSKRQDVLRSSASADRFLQHTKALEPQWFRYKSLPCQTLVVWHELVT